MFTHPLQTQPLLFRTPLVKAVPSTPRSERAKKYPSVVFLVLAFVFVAFVGVVVVLVVSMFVHVNHLIDRIGDADLTSRVDEIMDMARHAAHNTERATVEIAAAATLTHEMAAETRPQVNHMLNTTHELVDSAKSFAFHPRLVIGT